MMNIKPLKANVLIERHEKADTTSTGIYIARNEEADKATVVAIGPDVDEVEVGNVLLVDWTKATKVQGQQYMIPVENIVAVFG